MPFEDSSAPNASAYGFSRSFLGATTRRESGQSQGMEDKNEVPPEVDWTVRLKNDATVDARIGRALVRNFTSELTNHPENIPFLLALANDPAADLPPQVRSRFQEWGWLTPDGAALRDDVLSVFRASFRPTTPDGTPCFVDPFLPQNTKEAEKLSRLEQSEEAFLRKLLAPKERPGGTGSQGRG